MKWNRRGVTNISCLSWQYFIESILAEVPSSAVHTADSYCAVKRTYSRTVLTDDCNADPTMKWNENFTLREKHAKLAKKTKKNVGFIFIHIFDRLFI